MVVIDIENRQLNVELSDAEIQTCLDAWPQPAPRYTSGVFAKYAAQVTSRLRRSGYPAGQ